MNISIEKSKSFISARPLRLASAAAIAGCIACCLGPGIAVGLGGSVLGTTLAAVFRPGSALLIGGLACVVTAGGLAFREAMRRRTRALGCGSTCNSDGGCCGGTSEPRLPQ
jgi:hypothetical protein